MKETQNGKVVIEIFQHKQTNIKDSQTNIPPFPNNSSTKKHHLSTTESYIKGRFYGST